MARHITDDSGRIVPEGDPEYNEVRIGNLEQRVRELTRPSASFSTGSARSTAASWRGRATPTNRRTSRPRSSATKQGGAVS